MRRASADDRHGRGHLTGAVDAPATSDPATSPSPPPARERARRIVAIAAGAVIVAGLAGYALRPTTDPRVEGGVAELEEPFPGLEGPAVVGPPVDTGAMEWSVLVVNVWATWCEPCRREQPALLRVQEAYEGRGVEFLGIDYQDDRAKARRWIEDFEVTYPSLFDPDGRTAASFGFPFLPDTYLVDASGTMRSVVYGETSAEELSALIDGLLAEASAADGG
jgi:cytochrome c biogenesis protein CcmG, thiol:disulfide interchange protein DsbE